MTVSGPGGSSAPRQLELTVAGPPVATLTVTVSGGGTVDVDGTPCSDVCTTDLTPGTTAGLSVPGRQFPSVFDGWGGACSGTGGCDVVVSEDTAVTAAFHQAPVEPEDCLTTNRGALAVVPEDGKWLLTDGTRMAILDSEEDANNALAVAQHFTANCFIGRPGPAMTYWNGPTFGTLTLSRTDCIAYDNTDLAIQSSPGGWQLIQGSMLMATFETEADAGRGRVVAQASSRQCFVGRVSPPGEITYFLP